MMTSYYPEIRVVLDEGAHMPERAHDTDAGADLRCIEGFLLPARGSASIDTGVHVELPPETKGELVSKSGLNIRHGITSTGLIDEGYDGSIVVELHNNSDEDYEFVPGEKITQLVVSPVCYPTYQEADEIGAGERGGNGYGSTGRV